jgi:organic radical activating enzyme
MIEYRSVEFNVRIGCPIRCGYCPQDKVINTGYSTKTLSLDTLSKVLVNASKGVTSIDVIFSGHSEPFSVPNWYDLISHSHNLLFVRRVIIFSTGYRLSEEDIRKLSLFKKLSMVWHLGDKDLMPGVDESFISKLPLVHSLMPKSKFVCIGLEDTFDRIRKVTDSIGAELKFDKVINRAGNLEAVTNHETKQLISLGMIKKETGAVTCRYVNEYRRPVVMPDGTTLVCPNDYGSDLIIGNLANQEWRELDFNKIRNLQSSCSEVICKRGCHQAVPA